MTVSIPDDHLEVAAAGIAPLAGMNVVDFSRFAPGLFCTTLLGDLGATVITVEPPAGSLGESHLGGLPNFAPEFTRSDGTNEHWRARRSIVVDLKKPRGAEVVLKLVQRADVVVEGFRPGTAARLGIGFEQLRVEKPDLIYCSISGFGQSTKKAQQVGHDLNYLAEAGLLSALSRNGTAPAIPLNAVADIAAGGLFAAFSIMVALERRRRSGEGAYLDVSMFEGLLSLLSAAASWHPEPSWGRGMLSGLAPFYDCYETADGEWLSVAPLEPKFFTNLCDAIGRPDLVTLQGDVERWAELRAELAATFVSATLEDWLTRLADVDCAVAQVRSLADAFALGRELEIVRRQFAVGPLPRFADSALLTDVVREPGTHTVEVLEAAGFNQKEIAELLTSENVQQSGQSSNGGR